MRLVTELSPITLDELHALARGRFGDMVVAEGAAQEDLWGINLYPELAGEDWLEFDSMINLRPSSGNRSRGVDDAATRTAIAGLIARLVAR